MDQNKILLFDISGVLVELGGMPDFVEWTGRNTEDIGSHWLTSESVRDYETGRISFEEFHSLFIEEWQIAITQNDLHHSFESWVKRAFPGALALLAELEAQHTLACLTNTNSIQWPVIQKTIQTDTYFEHQFVSHLMGKMKPDTETFQHVIESLGVPPENIVFFDDSATNVSVANTLGIPAYHVNGIDETRTVLMQIGLL